MIVISIIKFLVVYAIQILTPLSIQGRSINVFLMDILERR